MCSALSWSRAGFFSALQFRCQLDARHLCAGSRGTALIPWPLAVSAPGRGPALSRAASREDGFIGCTRPALKLSSSAAVLQGAQRAA